MRKMQVGNWQGMVFVLLLALMGLSGCNSGGKETTADEGDETSLAMQLGESYAVQQGSRLWTSGPEAAEVEIVHDFGEDSRTVSLLVGEAELAF